MIKRNVVERAAKDYWSLSRAYYDHKNGSSVSVQRALAILTTWLGTLDTRRLNHRHVYNLVEGLRGKIIAGKPEKGRRLSNVV